MKCQYCGFEMEEDDLFCGECGKKVEVGKIEAQEDIDNDLYGIQDNSQKDEYIDFICPHCEKVISYTKWQIEQTNAVCPWCEGWITFENTIED